MALHINPISHVVGAHAVSAPVTETVHIDSSVAAGDLLILIFSAVYTTALGTGVADITVPSGWNAEAPNIALGSGFTRYVQRVWFKASAGETTVNVSYGTSFINGAVLHLIPVSGADISLHGYGGSSANNTGGTVHVTAPDPLPATEAIVFAAATSITPASIPAPWFEIYHHNDTADFLLTTSQIKGVPGGGSSSMLTYTGSNQGIVQSWALIAAPPPPPSASGFRLGKQRFGAPLQGLR